MDGSGMGGGNTPLPDKTVGWLWGFLSGLVAAGVVAVLLLLTVPVMAADLPCPPKHYFCWQAKLAFKEYGVSRVVAKAKACGWTKEEIAEALKC